MSEQENKTQSYYERNREKVLARQKEWYHLNKHKLDKEKQSDYNHSYYEEHKEYIRRRFKERFYTTHPKKEKKIKAPPKERKRNLFSCELCEYYNVKRSYYLMHVKTNKHQTKVKNNEPREVPKISISFD
jgi:hypothetical protein